MQKGCFMFMKTRFYYFFIFILLSLLSSCSNSPLQIGKEADKNVINMRFLETGMTTKHVIRIMDFPNKIEIKNKDGQEYLIWSYLTKGIFLGQIEFIQDNFTPLVFKEKILQGWGDKFYKHIFNIDDVEKRIEYEKKSKYSDDKKEWPSNEHKIIETKQDIQIEKILKEDQKTKIKSQKTDKESLIKEELKKVQEKENSQNKKEIPKKETILKDN
jgi:hypothetical protein